MRTLFCLLCVFLFFTKKGMAQNSADCRTAIPVCADEPISNLADGLGDIEDFNPDDIRETGCLEKGSVSSANIENNTSWYVFRAGTDGQIGFDLEALPSVGSAITAEWDFALYGPDTDCASISNGTAQPIRCNYEVNSTRFTGMGINPESGQEGAPPLTANQNTYDEYLDVLEGEIYYLLINNFNTNFDGNAEPYTLTFTGRSVEEDQDSALDCTLRDEFLGIDIIACEGDPDIALSASNSPAGPDVSNIVWTVDYEDDGIIDDTLLVTGPGGADLIVSSPNSGRYFVEITTTFATTITDDILITFYGVPTLLPDPNGIVILDDLSDSNNVEFFVDGDGSYEYAINGGEFQDESVFYNIPPGLNTVIINDKNGCGTTEPIPFLVVGYPKFFTPNGDGIHDAWNILGIETLSDPVVFIFDRYGKLLKQLDASTIGWDGTFNGRPLPSSDYWFRLEYSRDENGVLVANTLRNHFSLVR